MINTFMKNLERLKFHYIYKTVCSITGRFYIGMHSTNILEDGYLGSGKILRRSVRKHGDNNHRIEILEFVDSFEVLKQREKFYVTEQLMNDPLCMNLRIGGDGGFSFINSSKDILEKMKQNKQTDTFRQQARNKTIDKWKDESHRDKFYSTVKSEEYRLKRSFQMKAIYELNPDIKKKLSDSKIGDKNPAFGKIWITNGVIAKLVNKDQELEDGWKFGLVRQKRKNHVKHIGVR